MEKTNVEVLFESIDQITNKIQDHKDLPYLESLALSMEALFYNAPQSHLKESLQTKMNEVLADIDLEAYTTEEIRSALQLAILKGMQRTTQPQHLMTPEAVSLLVGYLALKLTHDKETLRIFDPVVGTASLLTTVLSQLPQPKEIYASDVDPTLIQLGLYNANLQKKKVRFFRQDSLQPFLLDPVDLVVADLPVGYYPDDVQASNYELQAPEGHSYSHHLLIEQSLHYTKAGGYLLLLIPEFLFDGDQTKQLHAFLREHAHIVGLLRLPESAFTSKKNTKSILILQKVGEETKAPQQPLLVDLPSLSNTAAMEDILGQMNAWFKMYDEELGKN